jgi:hypothetical protein
MKELYVFTFLAVFLFSYSQVGLNCITIKISCILPWRRIPHNDIGKVQLVDNKRGNKI